MRGKKVFIFLPILVLAFFVFMPAVDAAVVPIADVTVKYPDGSPVDNFQVEFHTQDGTVMEYFTTDANGEVTVTEEENDIDGLFMILEIHTPPDGYLVPLNSPYDFTYAIGDDVRSVDFVFVAAPKEINVSVVDQDGVATDANIWAQAINDNSSASLDSASSGTLDVTGGDWLVTVDANLSETDPEKYPWMNTGPGQKVSFIEDNTAEAVNLIFTTTKADSLVSLTPVDVNGDILTQNNFQGDVTFIRSDGVKTQRKVDSSGLVQVYLLPGIYRIWAFHYQIDDTQTFANQTIVVTAGQDNNVGTMQAVLKGSTISGVLKDNNGNPIPDESMFISQERAPERESEVETATDGSFTFTVGPGDYTIGLDDIDEEIEDSEGTVAQAAVDPSKRLDGLTTVHVETNSETIAGINLTAHSEDMTVSGTISPTNVHGVVTATSNDGEDVFYGAIDYTTGEYELAIPTSIVDSNKVKLDVATQDDSNYSLAKKVPVTVRAGNNTEDLSLTEDTATINGTLKDNDGNAETDPGATVEIIATEADGSVRKATVDANGEYSLDVFAGDWNIAVDVESEEDANITPKSGSYKEVTIKDGKTKTASLKVYENEATVVGLVTDNNGAPVGGAPVLISNENKSIYKSTTTDADGEYSTSVPIGKLTVAVGSNPNVDDLIEPQNEDIKAKAGETDTVNLAYREAEHTVSGTVNTKADILDGKVVAFSTNGGFVEADIESDGDYSLALSDNTWQVVASGLVEGKKNLFTSVQKKVKANKDKEVDLKIKNTGIEMPAAVSKTADTSELITVGNETGAKVVLEPYSAASSGLITVDLNPVPEVMPTEAGVQIGVAMDVKVISDSKEITQLNQPATIILPTTDEGVIRNTDMNEDKIATQYWSPEEELWQSNGMAGAIDEENQQVMIRTDHLTRFSTISKVTKTSGPKKAKNLRVKKYKKSRKVKLRWRAIDDAETIKVQLWKKKKKIKAFTLEDGNSKLVKKKLLKKGKQYKFRVRGINYWGQKAKWSKWKRFKVKKKKK